MPVSLERSFRLAPTMSVIMRVQCIGILCVCSYLQIVHVLNCRVVWYSRCTGEMAEGDWDEVTVIRKRAPKAGQLKTPQVTHVLEC